MDDGDYFFGNDCLLASGNFVGFDEVTVCWSHAALHHKNTVIIIQYESFYYSFRIVFAFLLGDCLCFLLSRTMIKVLQEESLLHQKRKVLLIIASKTGFNLIFLRQ